MFSAFLSAITNMLHLILGIATPQNFPPPLSQEDETRNFILMKNGDRQARQTLILHNLRLVSHIVRKYYPAAKNQEDLISIGILGLVKAVDTFKPENGARFATYGAKCVQNEILMYFRAQKKLAAEISINDTIDVDRDGNPLTYIDVISCEENVTEEVDRKIMTDRALMLVDSLLSEREREIIILRYGLGNRAPLTQREIADKLGISRSYVSRIEKSALDKLHGALCE